MGLPSLDDGSENLLNMAYRRDRNLSVTNKRGKVNWPFSVAAITIFFRKKSTGTGVSDENARKLLTSAESPQKGLAGKSVKEWSQLQVEAQMEVCLE